MTKRIDDVRSNIDFAMEQNRELSELIGDAQKNDTQVRFISQKSGSILSTLRECYDYSIADIRDVFFPKERRRVYFPFHLDSLSPGKPLYELKATAPKTYDYLRALAASMKSSKLIPGTMCAYSDARSINDLVNAKKHNKVLLVEELGNAKTRIEMPDGSVVTTTPMYPMRDDGTVDWSKPHGNVGTAGWVGSPGVQISAVKDFRFNPGKIKMSRTDVHGFCMIAITTTRFIMGEVYSSAFSTSGDMFRES